MLIFKSLDYIRIIRCIDEEELLFHGSVVGFITLLHLMPSAFAVVEVVFLSLAPSR